MVQVNILVEGMADEPVAKKLLNHVGLEVGVVYGRKGKHHLLQQTSIYNRAAKFAPWFVLVDLDTDTHCAAQAIAQWLPSPAQGMRFRIAVRAIEAWLMADRERMAEFLSVAPSKLQHAIELDSNPKQTLINIARTSRDRSIRDAIVPRQESGATVGPLYVAQLTKFVEKHWRPDVAQNHSKSLRHCIDALSTLTSFKL